MAGLGSTPGIIVGVGVGAAASAALEPAIEIPKQEAWTRNPNRILDSGLLARLVAQGGVTLDAAVAEAQRDGYAADKLAALVYLAQTVPGIGEAIALWRLGLLNDGLFRHVLVKEGLDSRYLAPIIDSKTALLPGLGDIAYAVVRGILPAPAYVPVAPPTSGDKVPRFPVLDINPEELAAKLGYSAEMLQLMVGRSGLSMAPGMAAQASFREIIGPRDFLLAIAEGDLRTEWADAVLEVSRQIPTAEQFVEGQVRGRITQTQRRAGTAKHGMTDADSDLLYEIAGRGLPVHAVTTGLARGGTYPSTYDDVPAGPYRDALERALIRPEFASLAYANRYSYPSAFVIRSLATSGEWDEQTTRQTLLELGWKPELVEATLRAWYGAGPAVDANVKKAHTKAWTEAQTSYINAEATAADVAPIFTLLGVSPASQAEIVTAWDAIRALVRKQLSPAQVKKAYAEQVVNPATGAAWTQADALAALHARGYDDADARTLLEL